MARSCGVQLARAVFKSFCQLPVLSFISSFHHFIIPSRANFISSTEEVGGHRALSAPTPVESRKPQNQLDSGISRQLYTVPSPCLLIGYEILIPSILFSVQL